MDKNLEISVENINSDLDSDYIGIDFEEGKFKFIFPRGYNFSKNKNSDIILLIKMFEKYNKTKNIFNKDLCTISNGEENNFSIINAIWLLKDYEKNGMYKEFLKTYKIDKKGNINWSKTIKNIKPYIYEDTFAYLDFVVNKNKDNLNNIILLIQKYIIKRCIDILGWLYPNIKINGNCKLPYSKNICIIILKKELKSNNLDRTKTLITHMIKFLENDSGEDAEEILKDFKTKYFQNIWENMLNIILGNENPSDYYPSANWNINGKNIKSSNLRPDIILKNNNIIYVIDAKYYKYGITENEKHLPQSSDIIKQLMYSEYIKTLTGCNAYDAFILPYKSKDQCKFKFIGNANINICSLKNKKILCILADTKTIIQSYVNEMHFENFKNTIIDIIDNENK